MMIDLPHITKIVLHGRLNVFKVHQQLMAKSLCCTNQSDFSAQTILLDKGRKWTFLTPNPHTVMCSEVLYQALQTCCVEEGPKRKGKRVGMNEGRHRREE